jgi:Uma2 family endonuclease
MATIEQLVGERRVVLRGVPWEVYEALRDIEASWHVRMAYDGGTLEMMSPSGDHEWIKTLVAQMIEAFTAELRIPRRSLGSTTWRRRELDKGLEADECYYILNHAKIRARYEIDLAVDPPPDLALEVDLRRGDVDKAAIYAALGVPEIWRWRDDGLHAYVLGDEGVYAATEYSVNLPMLRVKDLEPFLDQEQASDESAWINSFRAWVRERYLPAS